MEGSNRRKSNSWISKLQGLPEGESKDNREPKKTSTPSWKVDSAKDKGRKYEKKAVKDYGGKPTPMSGAGSIKYDGMRKAVEENEASIIEVKKSGKSFTLKRRSQ